MTGEVSLEMDEAVFKAVTEELHTQMVQSVSACKNRDDEFQSLRSLNNLDEGPSPNPPWKNSCEYESTLMREHHTLAQAQSVAALDGAVTMFNPRHPVADGVSAKLETWWDKFKQHNGWLKARTEWLYNIHEQPMAPLFVGWVENERKIIEQQAIAPMIDEEGNEVEGEPVTVEKLMADPPGLYYEVVDPWHFYTIPANAPSVKQAQGAFRRLWRTKSEVLLDGENGIYDKQAAMDAIMGAAKPIDTPAQTEQDDRDGIDPQTTGAIEIFEYFGRLPVVFGTDNELQTPRRTLEIDVLTHITANGEVLKLLWSPYNARPFVVASAYPIPNRMVGHSTCSLIRDLQRESTDLKRAVVDSGNLAIMPPFTAPPGVGLKALRDNWRPLGLIESSRPEDIKPISLDLRGTSIGLELIEALRADADRLTSAEGMSSMTTGRQGLNQEVNASVGTAAMLSDLVLYNIGMAIVEADEIGLEHCRKWLGEGDEVSARFGPSTEVTAADLATRHTLSVQAQTANINPQSRTQRAMTIAQVVRESPIYQMMLQSGDFNPEYKLLQTVLSTLDVSDPAEIGLADPATLVPPQPMTEQAPPDGGQPVGP